MLHQPQSAPKRHTVAKNTGLVSNSNEAESTSDDTLCLIRHLNIWVNYKEHFNAEFSAAVTG
jgi:hypothetical protein